MSKFVLAVMCTFLFSVNSFADSLSCALYDDGMLIESKAKELDAYGNAELEMEYDIHFFGAAMRERDVMDLWLATPIEETQQKLTGTLATRSSQGTLITFKCDYIH